MKYKGIMLSQVTLAVLMFVIITAATLINAPKFLDLGREDKALADTSTLAGLISQYEMEVGSYPDDLEDLTKKKGQYGPWLKDVPKDPYYKNHNYQYQHNSEGFIVFSVGKDKSASSSLSSGIKNDDIGHRGK